MSLHPRAKEIIEWLETQDKIPEVEGMTAKEVWGSAYQTWAKNGTAWKKQLGAGGTYTMRALLWYQHVRKPGSTDSRPGIILNAIAEQIDKEKREALAEKAVTDEWKNKLLEHVRTDKNFARELMEALLSHVEMSGSFSKAHAYWDSDETRVELSCGDTTIKTSW
jgi:hypothetical protein